jgi:hypothetical protein
MPEDQQDRVLVIPEIHFQSFRRRTISVMFPSTFLRRLAVHCGDSNLHGREVAGLIVGHVLSAAESDPVSVVPTDILEFPDYDSSGAHVTVPSSVWAQVDREFEERFGNLSFDRLGWYHTHPTQGVRLFSVQDCDFHSLFTRDFQFALVVDPRNMETGTYVWTDTDRSQISRGAITFKIPRRLLSPARAFSEEPEIRSERGHDRRRESPRVDPPVQEHERRDSSGPNNPPGHRSNQKEQSFESWFWISLCAVAVFLILFLCILFGVPLFIISLILLGGGLILWLVDSVRRPSGPT